MIGDLTYQYDEAGNRVGGGRQFRTNGPAAGLDERGVRRGQPGGAVGRDGVGVR